MHRLVSTQTCTDCDKEDRKKPHIKAVRDAGSRKYRVRHKKKVRESARLRMRNRWQKLDPATLAVERAEKVEFVRQWLKKLTPQELTQRKRRRKLWQRKYRARKKLQATK